jgi:transposase, IS30 family
VPQPRVPWSTVRTALVAVCRGASPAEAAELAGCSESTVWRRLRDEPVVVLRERRPRPGALTLEERFEIQLGIALDATSAEIARRIGRHRGTVGNEINANGGRERYNAARAQERADEQARRPKLHWFEERPWLWAAVLEMLLGATWSPRAIAKRLRAEHPDDEEWWVSHEAIYQAIYIQARGELKKELARALQSQRTRRKPRGRKSVAGSKITGMVNISERPAEAADRAVPGHWEGDLVVGAGGKSAVATVVERSTRFGMIIKLESKNAEHVAARIAEHLTTLPEFFVRSLTWDQGTEMAAHHRFSVATGIPVFFCDPRSPWQRPTNESWNRYVRWFIGRGDLSVFSQDELDTFARKINGRPREILGWKTAAERFEELVVAATA